MIDVPSSDYKLPISVLVVVHSVDNQILLLRRTDPANYWQSVTGSLRPGESPIDAARRELLEETSISSGELIDTQQLTHFPIIPPWHNRYAPDVTHNTEHLFYYCLATSCPVVIARQEHNAYRWVTPQEALKMVASPTNRAAIAALAGAGAT